MNKRALLLAVLATTFTASAMAADSAITFSKKWTYKHVSAGQVSEIPAFDHKTNTVWVAGVVGVDVLNADTGALIRHIDVTPYGYVNCVAVHNGLAAFATLAVLQL